MAKKTIKLKGTTTCTLSFWSFFLEGLAGIVVTIITLGIAYPFVLYRMGKIFVDNLSIELEGEIE